ncbi:MAG TPA: 1-(5-phosphoribosyl)-5-[(5-phosphoribosylamino)methylideneamino] imidazole-4-carboxamide isomerase [Candidatus Nitrosotalea sp.]|nr:1-(5-phosphoribosyl)-5-[(5-phosphoribosylamino)methylideneamino] imidazole-4-carboxamide isomerase [Candidatus Nitrosotalea sp.]
MLVIPALDLRDGRVVRLRQGDFDRQTSYSGDPLELASAYAAAGASKLHLVDLDAARGGNDNRQLILSLVANLELEIQVAGGVRGAEQVSFWLEAGAAAVVMGTTAVLHPDQLQRLASEHPGRILAALDVRAGQPMIEGWAGGAEIGLEQILLHWSRAELGGVILTSVDRDGTLDGPDLEVLRRVRELVGSPLTYSGGLGEPSHLSLVAAAGADAVILGRSLLEGLIPLQVAFDGSWDRSRF